MKQSLLAILLMLAAWPVLARGMSARETTCYDRLRDEANFIVSRINLIHREYENQVKRTGLGQYRSGRYSTADYLDNTIRKYHRKLVHRIRAVPRRYAARLRQGQHATCQAREMENDSVGTIHEFELSWQQALRQARKNVRFFKQLNDMH